MHDTDHSDRAAYQVRRTALAEDMAALANKPVRDIGNGSIPKATKVLAMLNWRGVKPSYAGPRVSAEGSLPSWCSAPPSTDRSLRPKALPTSTQHALRSQHRAVAQRRAPPRRRQLRHARTAAYSCGVDHSFRYPAISTLLMFTAASSPYAKC